MMEGLALLWQKLLGSEPPKGKRSHLYVEKVKLLKGLPAGIYKGEEGASLSKEELDKLLAPIKATLSAHSCVLLTRFLSRGLTKGKRNLDWSVAVPSVPLNFPRERARFTPQKFVELQLLRRIEEALIRSLTEKICLTHDQQFGRLILSAVLFGGLIQLQWLEPWTRAARSAVRTDGFDLWLDLERCWLYSHKASEGKDEARKRNAEKPILITRRWFADPLTRVMLLLWHSQPDSQQRLRGGLPNAYDLVRMFLVRTGFTRKDLPANASVLLGMAETRLALAVPPFLASYASGWLNGVSVPSRVWTRLCSGKIVERQMSASEDEDIDSSAEPGVVTVALASRTATLDAQHKLLKEMQKIFSGGKKAKKGNAQLRRELAEYLKQRGQELSPLLSLRASWVNMYLAKDSNRSSETPKRYLGSISNILLVVFGMENVLDLEAEDLIERYDRAVEIVKSDKEKGYARSTIGRFHHYLVCHHDVAKLHQGYFRLRSGPPETTVDANLLSQSEFDRLKYVLGWNDGNRPRTATAAILVAILGFRCGMRRNEVHKLRVRDIQGYDKPEVILCATKRRSLKSPSATRRLPLYILLTQEEIHLLRSWLSQFEWKDPEALLFCVRDKPHELIPEAYVFSPIRKALAMVTGDATLRFHHLRHSFATWLLIRLTGNGTGLRDAAPFLNHSEFDEQRVHELRSFLLGNEYLGRKGAYAVASLCGHADLDTMFTSYIHLCDWLLGRELSRRAALPVLSAEAMMGATGLSRATIYLALNDSGVKGPNWDWSRLFKSFRKMVVQIKDPLLKLAQEFVQQRVEFPAESTNIPLWRQAQRALTLHQVEKMMPEEIGDIVGIEIETVNRWIATSAAIGEMKGLRSGDRYFKHRDFGRLGVRKRRGVRKGEPCEWIGVRAMVEKSVFPVKPKGNDYKIAELMLNSFENLSYQEQQTVFNQVAHFIWKFNIHSRMRCFRESGEARRYVDTIRLLGIGKQMIILADCKNNLSDREATKERRTFWENELNLKNARWCTVSRDWGHTAEHGTIGIRVSADRSLRSSYGFRYAFYMIAITYCVISGRF